MIREKLITAAVKNLKEFGYENCTKENILTDEVYSAFFINMLEQNKGYSKEVDKIIEELISEIK